MDMFFPRGVGNSRTPRDPKTRVARTVDAKMRNAMTFENLEKILVNFVTLSLDF